MKSTLVLLLLLMVASQAVGTIYIYDGQVHNYYSNTTFTEGVVIDREWPGTGGTGVPGIGTVVNVYGATFEQNLRGWEDSDINVYYGDIWYLEAFDRTDLKVYGGTIDALVAGANAEISGGTIGNLKAGGASTQITGGSFPYLVSYSSGTTFIYGTDFAIDGVSSPYGEYTSITGKTFEFEPDRQLTGTLANGEALDATFRIADTAKIVLIPEPFTSILLALGVCFLKRK